MTCKRLSIFCWLLGCVYIASCVPASSGRSARAAADYKERAEKILKETPLVDG